MASAWEPMGNAGDNATRLQSDARTGITQLASAIGVLQKHSNIMAQMLNGGTDYTTIETMYGLPTGTGQLFHDKVGTAANSGDAQGLIQVFG